MDKEIKESVLLLINETNIFIGIKTTKPPTATKIISGQLWALKWRTRLWSKHLDLTNIPMPDRTERKQPDH